MAREIEGNKARGPCSKEPMRRLGVCIWKGKQQLLVSLQTLGTSKEAEAPHWPCVRMWQGG